MHGTETGIRPARGFSGTQVAAAEVEPAWRPWVRLLDIALEATADAEWGRVVLAPVAARSPSAPLLHGAVLRVDARRIRKLVRDLLREAERVRADDGESPAHSESGVATAPRRGTSAIGRHRRLDALGVLQGAIMQDGDIIERVATTAGVDAARFGAVAQLAAIPLLVAMADRYRTEVPESWTHGYCPVCSAWPALAEVRGLERNRRLRCGRCATDWPIPVLRCPFCDELRHDQLHALLPEGEEQTRRVDVCETCKGYIKGFSTLRPMGLRALAIADLTTIDLDLVSQERGYARPPRPAYALSVTVERKTGPRKE